MVYSTHTRAQYCLFKKMNDDDDSFRCYIYYLTWSIYLFHENGCTNTIYNNNIWDTVCCFFLFRTHFSSGFFLLFPAFLACCAHHFFIFDDFFASWQKLARCFPLARLGFWLIVYYIRIVTEACMPINQFSLSITTGKLKYSHS